MAIGARIVNDSGGRSQTYTTKTGASLDGSRKADAKTSYQVSNRSGFTPTVTVPTTPSAAPISSGGGSSSSGSSSGGGGGGFDLSSYLASLQAAANNAYNRARSSLDTTLSTTLGGLLDSYEAQKKALQGKYDSSKQTLDDDNASALQQAYINKMINARDMDQLLTAQGLTGGASETNIAKMLNNYANNRNSLNRTYNTNLRELLTGHESLLADALSAYNDKVANARQSYSNYLAQLEQNRANMIASAMPSFSNLLSLLG